MTPIQEQSIPIAMSGCDLLASAQTGSGKTFSYLIPLLTQLEKAPESRALILVPTRELATQVVESAELLLKDTNISGAVLIGGASMDYQIRKLRRNPQIIIATPGRLIDLMDRGFVDLSKVYFLVLDEADRMLDMGFAPQLKIIRDELPTTRQSLLFSATLPPNIQKLSKDYLKNPRRVQLNRSFEANAAIEQKNVDVTPESKDRILLDEIATREGLILVFVKTQRRCDRLGKNLYRAGISSSVIHGGLRQRQREGALEAFKSGQARVLVATDIAARGLDISNVEHVINYDIPQVPEDYIHRIGRTGRAGKTGKSLSLVSPEERSLWKNIVRKLAQLTGGKADDEGSSSRGFSRPFNRSGGGGGGKSRYSHNNGSRGHRKGGGSRPSMGQTPAPRSV